MLFKFQSDVFLVAVRVQGSRMPNETTWFYDDESEVEFMPLNDPTEGQIEASDPETYTFLHLANGKLDITEDWQNNIACLCEIPRIPLH